MRPTQLSLGYIKPIIGFIAVAVENPAEILPQSRLSRSSRARQHDWKEADQRGDGYPQPSSLLLAILPIGISLPEPRLVGSHYRRGLDVGFGFLYWF